MLYFQNGSGTYLFWHSVIFFPGLIKEFYLAFVNSAVHFSKKSFTKNPTHDDVISGDVILFYKENKQTNK